MSWSPDDELTDDLVSSEWDSLPWDDVERANEQAWHHSMPFTSGRESEDRGVAAVYGDAEASERLWDYAQARQARMDAVLDARLHQLSHEQLRAMRDWDRANFFHADDRCDVLGCDEDNGRHHADCVYSLWCGWDLEVHGEALRGSDPTFWEQLRKLGPTPAMLAKANSILQPHRGLANLVASRKQFRRPLTPRRRTRTRARGRRSAPSRRIRGAARAGPDDGPAGEPPGRRWLREHRDVDHLLLVGRA